MANIRSIIENIEEKQSSLNRKINVLFLDENDLIKNKPLTNQYGYIVTDAIKSDKVREMRTAELVVIEKDGDFIIIKSRY